MAAAMTTAQVKQAAMELGKMRSSLTSWLKYRSLNDQVRAGIAKVRKPLPYAQRVVVARRDMAVEQDLATKLHALLEQLMPDARLPDPDVTHNPAAAVQLAQLAITGGSQVPAPVATSGLFAGQHPWLWPVLIVGGLLIAVTTAIKTAADVAKDQEEKACIEAGACTDYGFWLKAGGIAALVYIAWKEFGLDRAVKGIIGKKGRS